MINLTEKDKEIIKHLGYSKKVNLSSGSYYIKLVGAERGLKELLGSTIATQIGLITPRNNLVSIDEEIFLLSEDLNDYGKFIKAEDLEIGDPINEYCSIEEAIYVLKNNYHLGSEIENLIRIYTFDILFKHFDRNKGNWGLLYLPDSSPKLAILDHEYLLVDNDRPEKLKLYYKRALPLSLEEDFIYFLQNGDPKDIQIFDYYFNLYTPEFINNILNQIIKINNINFEEKDELIAAYQTHYLKLQEIYLQEYKEKYSR